MHKRLSGETPKIAALALGIWPQDLPGQILLVLVLLCFAVQAGIFLGVFAPLSKAMRKSGLWIPLPSKAPGHQIPPAAAKEHRSDAPLIPIPKPDPKLLSVVVCARNEAENLRQFLPFWLNQEGVQRDRFKQENVPQKEGHARGQDPDAQQAVIEDYELIVVDDGSTDATPSVLKAAAAKHPRLRVLRLEPEHKTLAGKKGPLDLGLRAARGEWVLLTDADCRPASTHWIRHMVEAMVPSVDVVLGVGQYARHAGPLNAWVRYETFHTAIQYLSWTLRGMPYMGVGRNLAYRRSLWAEQGGFASHADWPSGDDDLSVNQMARKGRVSMVWAPAAWTISRAPKTWKAWYRQRLRHFSTGGKYRAKHRFWLGTYAVSHFGLFAFTFSGWAIGALSPWWSVLLVLRWSIQWATFGRLMPHLRAKDLWHFSTILDVAALLAHGTFVRVVLSPKMPDWR